MKKSTLALAFGAGLATAVMGTTSPASALSITGTGGTGTLENLVPAMPSLNMFKATEDFNVTPGATSAAFLNKNFASGDYYSGTVNLTVSATNNSSLPWDTFTFEHPNLSNFMVNSVGNTTAYSSGKAVVTFSTPAAIGSMPMFNVSFTAPASGDFTIKQYGIGTPPPPATVPEPSTVLGMVVSLGVLPLLKKRNKKEGEDA